MTRSTSPADRAADPARTPAGPAALKGHPVNPPDGVPRPSPSLPSRTAPSAAAREPDPETRTPSSRGAQVRAQAGGPARVRAGGAAQDPGSASSHAEPDQVPGGAPDASALPAGPGQTWQRGRGAIAVSARCGGCDWTPEGDWAAIDRAAEKHAKRPGHPVTVVAEPARGAA